MLRNTFRSAARLAAVAVLFVAILPAITASAGSETSTNSCQNSATGTFTDIDITLNGTATGDASSVTLGGAQLAAFFPADVLVAGYNLGLLTVGVNDIPGTLSAVIDGSNTSEGTQTAADVALTGQTTITDPDGTPGNGDETATDLSVTVPLPDTTWTPTGGDVAFSSNGSTIEASLLGGVIKVSFNCSIGTSTPAGCVADPATDCTGFDPATAAPFETFTADAPTTTTTTTPTTTTTEGPTTTTTTVPATTTTVAPSEPIIEIPVRTVVRTDPGVLTTLAEADVPDDLVGEACTVRSEATNNSSVHAGNDLIVASGDSEVVLADVERASGVVTIAEEELELGESISITLEMGPDGVFSANALLVVIDCAEPPTTTTTTTTTVPTTTTTVAPSEPIIEIPVRTVVRTDPGVLTTLAEADVPDDLVGEACTVRSEATNNSSVHAGNDLIVASGDSEVVLADVERASGVVTIAEEELELGESISITLEMGPDGVFSANALLVVIDCAEPPTTTTTTSTTSTTVPDTSTTSTTSTTVPDTSTTSTTSTTVPDTTTSSTTSTTVPTTTTTTPPSSQTTTNACQNSATGTFTDIDITLTGFATGDASSVVLRGTQLSAFFPADVLVAGYNLGLLTVGVNDIPGTLSAVIDASNTSEGSQTVADVVLTGQTTITDPDGTPGNGDETATDLSVTVQLPDTTWTPTGGEIAFSSNGATIEASLLGGVIKVSFNCSIGTSTPAGCVADPATDCTGFDPATAAPFVTFTPSGQALTTTGLSTAGLATSTTTAAPTTTAVTPTTAPPRLAFTGPGTTLMMGAVGFLLLDLGYLTASTAWPGRRRRRN